MVNMKPVNKTLGQEKVWKAGTKYLSSKDKVLKRIIKKAGISSVWEDAKKWWEPDYYESIVRSIIFQQISGSAGRSILKRFKTVYNGRLPTPKEFLKTDKRTVRKAGISPQKYSYLKDLCERITDGRLELKKFNDMPDEEIINELDEVRGIGRWTVEMYLIGTLRRVDVLPVDDLGIQKAIQKAYRLRRPPDKDKLGELSKRWSPYRTIASIYLWQSND